VAVGWTDGIHSSMRLDGVGVYHWSGEGPEVTVLPEPRAEPGTVVDAFHRCVLPMVLQARGQEVLHASAVLLPEGAIALCGRSRTGKSTLAYGLSRVLACPLWADDAVGVELTATAVAALALPFALKLRQPSAEHFGGVSEVVEARIDQGGRRAVPLAAVFVLTRSDDPHRPARASRIPAARAFTALLEHAYCFDLQSPNRRSRMVRQYLELSDRIPVFELSFPSSLEVLPDTIAEIDLALSGCARR